jgi:phage terminase large subunit-like protein
MAANWLPVHKEITQVISKHEDVMLFGGAGSGKTWKILYHVFLRALMMPGSRHICLRQRFEHTKNTLWPSAKEMVNIQWPGLWDMMDTNRSGGLWSMRINESEVLFGGLDDKERVEKHLGAEYATVYINECSEIADEEAVNLISSRLRQKVDGRHILFCDMNPPAKSHWSYRRYIEDKAPGRTSFRINPIDVRENLPASYIARLEALPERMRQRFLYGEFTSDIEGALWSWETIEGTRTELSGEEGRTVVGVDPAATNKEDSDETGIIVGAEKGPGWIIKEDLSFKGSPNEWGMRAIQAYHRHDADCVVVETNQGGDMIKTILNSLDPTVPVEEVRATKGKHTRAEPVVALYEQGLIEHAKGLDDLEDQMMSWVPHASESPDRVDALVWVLHNLALQNQSSFSLGWT